MSDVIPDAVVLAALDLVLRKPLGTSLKNYMPQSQADAIAAMRGVMMAERERAAALARRYYTSVIEADLLASAILKGDA
jgi:hypothetical protein